MSEYRSVSQLKEYDACPHRYYLHRIKKAWERPAAWLPQGLGVHEAAEAWEKSGRTLSLEDTEEVFRESYATHTNRLTADTPNFKFWFRSGGYRRTVEEDIKRRHGIGLEQVGKYISYYTEKKPKEVIYIADDGTPAIELPFIMDLGGVKVRGYIDQIIWDPVSETWIVRDIKTGKSPGDEKQLATYKVAVLEEHDIEIVYGDYWMAVSGKPTIPYDLTEWPRDRLTEEFQQLDENILAGRFDPTPTPDNCKMCPVNADCDFKVAETF